MKKNFTDNIFFTILLLALIAAGAYGLFTDSFSLSALFPGSEKPAQQADFESQQQVKSASQPKGSTNEILQGVREKAENRLDPSSVSQADIELVRQKAEQDKTREAERQYVEPITDVAPPQPVVDVNAAEHPYERLKKMNLPTPPQYKMSVKLPENTNPSKPERWTEPIANPSPDTQPPDPFVDPPMQVDPRRVPQE